ncbi:hypothetical protein Tco_0467415, partial [Tanacetum coccineum]
CIKSAYAQTRMVMQPPITKLIEGVETTIAPTTTEENAQRRLELKQEALY